jgi:hypothetical protein
MYWLALETPIDPDPHRASMRTSKEEWLIDAWFSEDWFWDEDYRNKGGHEKSGIKVEGDGDAGK